jgi:peptidyl-prolyl cis-trans isomerase B (cyclophilin B)
MSISRTVAIVAALPFLLAMLTAPVVAQDAPAPPLATPNPVALEAPAGDGTAVRLTTDLGDIVVGLFNQSAPVAAENFQNLAEAGFYDGVGFHRVVPGFVIQGGDPEGTGGGGPGYTIADEEVVGQYGRGIVAMARTRQPNSQGSQFFVVLDDDAKRSLDSTRDYAIFGRVVEGMDVVDAIVARGPASDRIEDPVRIQSATIEQVDLPPEPTTPPPTEAELAAEALLARLPTEIAGIALVDRTSFAADVLSGGLPPEALDALGVVAESHGTDLGQLSLARAGGPHGETYTSLLAGTIVGVPADEALLPMARAVLGIGEETVSTEETIADRTVTRFELPSGQLAYAIPSGDVVWVFLTDEGSLEEVVSSLP